MSQDSVHSVVHPKQGRARLALAVWTLVLATLLVVAYGMHQRANAAPVSPMWQQAVVTIDDAASVAAAQQWGAPFTIAYAARGADITVTRGDAGDRVEGHATTATDGDRITSCAIVVDPTLESVGLLVHEVGHCLGLSHIATSQRSVLYVWGQSDREHGSATVTDVDRAALAALYSEVK